MKRAIIEQQLLACETVGLSQNNLAGTIDRESFAGGIARKPFSLSAITPTTTIKAHNASTNIFTSFLMAFSFVVLLSLPYEDELF
jgi:hypothetical protein